MTDDDWDAHHAALSEAAYGNPALRWRWRHIVRLLDLPRSAPVTVLDVGCGDGRFAAFLKAHHPNAAIVGVDGSAVGVAAAARRVPDGRFHCTDLQRPDPRLASTLAGVAAAAVCTEVLEHLDQPVACLRAVKGWLAPGGRLVITVPAGPMAATDRHFGHRKHYTREILLDEIGRAGLTAEGAWAAGFPFHTLYRLAALAYGGRAVDCQTGRAGGAENALVAAAYRGFDALFRLNLLDSPLGGWQLFARVRRDA